MRVLAVLFVVGVMVGPIPVAQAGWLTGWFATKPPAGSVDESSPILWTTPVPPAGPVDYGGPRVVTVAPRGVVLREVTDEDRAAQAQVLKNQTRAQADLLEGILENRRIGAQAAAAQARQVQEDARVQATPAPSGASGLPVLGMPPEGSIPPSPILAKPPAPGETPGVVPILPKGLGRSVDKGGAGAKSAPAAPGSLGIHPILPNISTPPKTEEKE